MQNYFILVMVLISFSFCDERTFNLKSGNKVTGEIINIDDSGNYTVNTSMGEVVFNHDEIVMENVKIITTDGDRIIGVLQNEDNDKFHVKTDIGLMSIAKNNVNSIDFNYNDIESDEILIDSIKDILINPTQFKSKDIDKIEKINQNITVNDILLYNKCVFIGVYPLFFQMMT